MSRTASATRPPARGGAAGEGGQALVEFALLLPLLLTVLFGTVEFGRLFVAYLDVVEAAHDAARVAALGGGTTSAVAAADGAAAGPERHSSSTQGRGARAVGPPTPT